MKTLLSLVCLLSAALAAPVDLSTYPLSAVLRDRGGEVYTLHWGFNLEAETIRFAVNVSTTGWVGFGLSPTGGMPNSDVVIGWVNNGGEAFLQDRYARTTSLPPVDPEQNWSLDGGMEMGGFTILAFSRDWVTCDDLDREIKVETARLIFSWNEVDPANDDPNAVMPHGMEDRGTLSLNLLGGQQVVPPDPADLESFDVTVQNITMPSIETTYWCSAFEIPTDVQAQKHYITKFAPVITPGNEAYVHHILVYECTSLNDTHVGESGVCDGQVSDTVSECRGGTLIAGWAVGGTEYVYPAGVAYPIGGGGPRYVVMETHYDNPEGRSGIRDSSGLEFSYTGIMPRFEAGVLQVGHAVSLVQVVPPGASLYNNFGDCATECTSRYFPPQGITVFGNLLHTHLAGVGATLHHYRRNGECNALEELEPIEQNLLYDFNYQQYTTLPSTVQVLPGDLLRLECNYNTEDRTSAVLGGPATQDEMCLSFVLYYPRTNLSTCVSLPNSQSPGYLADFVTDHVSLDALAAFLAARGRAEIIAAWNMVDWTPEAISSLESSTLSGPLLDLCIPETEDVQFFPRDGQIKEDCEYQAPNNCTGFVPTDCCSRVTDPTTDLGGSGVVLSSSVVLITLLSLTGVLSLL